MVVVLIAVACRFSLGFHGSPTLTRPLYPPLWTMFSSALPPTLTRLPLVSQTPLHGIVPLPPGSLRETLGRGPFL